MFDIKTVPDFVIKKGFYGDVEVTFDNGAYVMYNRGDLCGILNVGRWYEIQGLYSCYDRAYGDVLITGLGFGMTSRWIANKPGVKSVTVVEQSQDIIDMVSSLNDIPENLNFVCADALTYETDKHFDCVFLDHYSKQNKTWRFKNMQDLAKRYSHDTFWAFTLEQSYLLKMYNLDGAEIVNVPVEETFFNGTPFFGEKWQNFVKAFFPDEKNLLEISEDKINEYVYTYFGNDSMLKQ